MAKTRYSKNGKGTLYSFKRKGRADHGLIGYIHHLKLVRRIR